MKACATRAACKGAANDQTDQTAIKINLLQPAVSTASPVQSNQVDKFRI